MKNVWHDYPAERITIDRFYVVIEIPKGSKKKYEYDKETGLMRLDRILYTSTVYPMNYGFIPKTLAGDGDPLDVLVLCSEVLDPFASVECYPIGVVQMIDNNEYDEKILAIPFKDPTYNGFRDISTIPQHILTEISHFFEVYKELEHSKTSVKEIKGRDEAIRAIKNSIDKYNEKFNINKNKDKNNEKKGNEKKERINN